LGTATNDSAIIPDGAFWGLDLGDETAAGGAYSSPANITTLGRSILASTLLKPALTCRWMKPRAFTSDPFLSVGAPWK
jgi:hypothetical protein